MTTCWCYYHDPEVRPKDGTQQHHVGVIGQRQEIVVTCRKVTLTDDPRPTGIHRLADDAGNDLVWFASPSATWLEKGRTYRVRATILAHNEYQGRAQTLVSRVAVLRCCLW